MKYKIKHDKKTDKYEILEENIPIFSMSGENLLELGQKIITNFINKDYQIVNPKKLGNAHGFSKYHYIKGFAKGWLIDVKRSLKSLLEKQSKKSDA